MTDDRLNLEATFRDRASAGVKKLGKTLAEVKPSNGMAQANAWMKDFRGAAERANVAVRPITSTMTALGVGGLAAEMSMSALVRSFKDLADSTLTMKELGRQSGMTIDQINRLQYAAGKLHVDPAAVSGALRGWSSQMLDFRLHVSKFYTYLNNNRNGDIAKKILGDSPEQAFKDTLDYLSRIPEAAMKAGRSAADAAEIQRRVAAEAGLSELLPMAGQGPQALKEAFDEAGQNVKPITADLIAAADRLNASTTHMNQSWANLKNDVGPSVIEPLSHAIDALDETLKLAGKFPGEAAATAGVALGAAATLYARYRIMKGSMLAGGGGAMGRAAGEMTGAAREQARAGGSLMEAAIALKEAAAELRKGGTGGGGTGGPDPVKTAEKDAEKGGLAGKFRRMLPAIGTGTVLATVFAGITEAMLNRDQSKSLVDGGRPDVLPSDDNLGLPGVDTPSASDKWQAPSRYSAEARARDNARGRPLLYDAPNTDGNALRRNDEMPVARPAPTSASDRWLHPDDDRLSRARPDDLKRDIQEGAKAGIIAGLRELAQQQELDGKGGDSGGLGGSGIGADGGTPNMRRGRSASGKWRSTPGTEGGAPIGKGAVGGVFKGGRGAAAGLAKESYDFWRGKGLDHNAALSMVAQEEGESGFDYRQQRGDSGLAHGAFSWHPDRRAAILRETGINIDQASHLQQLEAAWHEGTKGSRAGFFQSLNGRDLRDAVYQGVHRFEGSRYQMKDTAARLGMARKWDGGGSFLAPKPAPSTPGANLAGAGTPAPSAAAISDGDVFKARQRIINGSRDPADRAIVDGYKRQQAKPEGHRAGGWIRGPGTGTSDSIPAMLSHGEYVINARASGQWLPLLHAINSGQMARFAEGGPVGPKPLTIRPRAAQPFVMPSGFGVPKQFYPTRTAPISPAEGLANRRSWRDFYRRPTRDGGMGASMRATLGGMAMMAGESGYGLNSKTYGWDVDGPSGGAEQWHDVLKGRWAGRIRRLSDLMQFGMMQHADWTDRTVQQAFKRREETTSFAGAWRRMLAAKTARGALKEGIDHIEIPADKVGELRKRMPNIARLQREAVADGAVARHEMDPLDVTISHHPVTGRPIVQAKAGKGVNLKIRTGATMRPT